MLPPDLSHIDHWIFDLDNVLYPAECDLFSEIDQKMGEFIADLLDCDFPEARKVQKTFFHDHGTTLAGLMYHHGTDPQEFLNSVHDIDMSRLSSAPRLREAIANLHGEKLIFTNADRPYAERVLEKRGLADLFDQMHDIIDANLIPKPQPAAYAEMVRATEVDPTRSLFVEDMARNLTPAKELGMTTVWVNTGAEWGGREYDPAAIDIEIPDLESWITNLHHDMKAKTL